MTYEETDYDKKVVLWSQLMDKAVSYYLFYPDDVKRVIKDKLDSLDLENEEETLDEFKIQCAGIYEFYNNLNTGFYRVLLGIFEEEQCELLERIETLEKEVQELKAGKSVTNVTNVCQHCSKEFETTRRHAQYCSRACRQAAYRARKEK